MQQIWNASSGVSSHENITVSPSWKICDDLGWSGSVKNCGVHQAIWVHHPTAFQLAPPAISSLCSTAGQLFVTAWPFFSHINLVRPCTMSNIFKCSTADQRFVTARPFSHRILVPPWIITSQIAFIPGWHNLWGYQWSQQILKNFWKTRNNEFSRQKCRNCVLSRQNAVFLF